MSQRSTADANHDVASITIPLTNSEGFKEPNFVGIKTTGKRAEIVGRIRKALDDLQNAGDVPFKKSVSYADAVGWVIDQIGEQIGQG